MDSIILEAKNIRKTFYHPSQTDILKGIDLKIKKGESIAITGRSGEGKSTLLYILGTLETACQGELKIASQTVSAFNKTLIRNRHIGFIFQSFHLLEDYTVLENVLMPARIARHSTHKGSGMYKQITEFLDLVGLSERMNHQVKQLSGGEKQRAAIARAFCNDPDIIFADEPSGNLDSHNAKIIHDLLLDFARKKNKAVVIVTHDQSLANLCDTQYHLHSGIFTR